MQKDGKNPYYTKSFSVSKENEKDIYDYLIEVEKNKKITEYIKELIRKDMANGFNVSNEISETYIKNLVNKLVEEKINSLNIVATSNETVIELADSNYKDEKPSIDNCREIKNGCADEIKNDVNKAEDIEISDKKIKKKKIKKKKGLPHIPEVMS